MPGIAGYINTRDDRDVTERIIGRMTEAMASVAPAVRETWLAGHAGLAAIRLSAGPSLGLVAEDEDHVLAFWGHLWDPDELGKALGGNVRQAKDVPLAEAMLILCRLDGIDRLCRMNGRFALALWSKEREILHLATDRQGFARLYYRHGDDGVAFASDCKALMRTRDGRNQIDRQAMAEFLAFGYCLDERTFVEDVRRVTGGSVVSLVPGCPPAIRRVWDYEFTQDENDTEMSERFEEIYFEALASAVRRQLQGCKRIVVPISAGLDSRMIAGLVRETGYGGDVITFSYGKPDCFDVAYGRRVARKAGFRHCYLPIEDTYLRDHAEPFVWALDGEVSCLNAHTQVAASLLTEARADGLMTGFLGDIVTGPPNVGDLSLLDSGLEGDTWFRQWVLTLEENFQQDALSRFARKDALPIEEGEPFGAYRRIYERLGEESRYQRVRHVELITRQRRYSAFNIYAYEGTTAVLAPFTDNRFVDVALGVPEKLTRKREIQRRVIVRYLPRVASVPWGKTRMPLNASWFRKGVQWRWERLSRDRLVRATIGRRYAAMHDNYIRCGEAIRGGSREFVVKNIRDNPFLGEFFEMQHVHRMLDDHLAGKADEGRKIAVLLTLCLWHRLLLEGEGFRQTPDVCSSGRFLAQEAVAV